jgi:hypothetical protein
MGSKTVGVVCVLFSACVFVYFTFWTIALPLIRPEAAPLLFAAFPRRGWLIALPYAGIVTLVALVATFIQICSKRAASERNIDAVAYKLTAAAS